MLPTLRALPVTSFPRSLTCLQVGNTSRFLPLATRLHLTIPTRHYTSKTKSSKHKLPKSAPSGSVESDGTPVTVVMSRHKHHAGEVVDEIAPGHPSAEQDPVAFELGKVETKMKGVVDWYRREVGGLETRGSGRVTPSLLDGVRVTVSSGRTSKLDEIATIGVREGNILVITVFDESDMKGVKTALQSDRYSFVPQTVDQRTLRIPIPRPTAETRQELAKAAARLAEDARIKIRTARESGMKAFKAEGITDKRDPSHVKCQKLTDDHIAEVDKLLQTAKQTLG